MAGGLYSFVYYILWRKAYDVLCKNIENDGLCVFKLLVPSSDIIVPFVDVES